MPKKKSKNPNVQKEMVIRNYLYADMDFIHSFLAQTGQGLLKTILHTNSSTSMDTEHRGHGLIEKEGSTLTESDAGYEAEGSVPGFAKGKATWGGDEKQDIRLKESIETLNILESESQGLVHAREVELHDYAINMFIQTIKSEKSNGSFKSIFEINDKEIKLYDYSQGLTEKIKKFEEFQSQPLMQQGLSSGAIKAEEMEVIRPAVEATLELLMSILPSPYMIRYNENQGYIYEKWLRVDMKSVFVEYGNSFAVHMIGYYTGKKNSVQNLSELEDITKMLPSFSRYFDAELIPMLTPSQTNDKYFKPILIYKVL